MQGITCERADMGSVDGLCVQLGKAWASGSLFLADKDLCALCLPWHFLAAWALVHLGKGKALRCE